MKTKLSLLVVFLIILAACSPATETLVPTAVATATETAMPPATIEVKPTLTFSAATYEDAIGKLTLQYPSDWTFIPEQVIGDRGSQTVLLSPGTTIEKLADGGSLVVLLKYSWDPKNDLSAWTNQRKLAWEASGFSILDESTRELEDGRAVVDLRMQAPDGTELLYSLTTIGDRYLEINATGDLNLCHEILMTMASTN